MPRVYADIVRIIDKEAAEIRRKYPDLKRDMSGYNLDRLVAEAGGGSINLARLLAGSEGKLALVTEAMVSLEPFPPAKSIPLLVYEDLLNASTDVAPILEHDPAAVEANSTNVLLLAARAAVGTPMRQTIHSTPRSRPRTADTLEIKNAIRSMQRTGIDVSRLTAEYEIPSFALTSSSNGGTEVALGRRFRETKSIPANRT